MIVEPIEQDYDKPFVKITYTRKEAEILMKVVRYDIETLTRSQKNSLGLKPGDNDFFALPLCAKLQPLLENKNDGL